MRKLIAGAALLLLLSGCTSAPDGDEAADATATPVAEEAQFPDTYATVEELRDAFIEAGGTCPSWEQKNQIVAAAESGTCSSTNVLSIYSSDAAKDEMVATLKSISEDGLSLLVGENWVINDPSVKTLDRGLGGTFVTN